MSDSIITSPQNPRIKQWAQLLERKGRDKQGKFLIEGVHLVQEALLSGAPVEAVLYSAGKGVPAELSPFAPDGPGANASGRPAAGSGQDTPAPHRPPCEWLAVSDAALAKCSDTRTPQGVMAVVGKLSSSAMDFAADPQALVVVADGVQDPGNLGTIIRCADAVAATAVILGRGTVDAYNPKTLRATMGSMFHLPVVEADLPQLLPQLPTGSRLQIIAASLQATESCYDADLTRPTWLVFGNEGAGISPAVSAFVTHQVRIPMPGRAESLNVAMAATVLLFEALRQRRFST